MSVFNSAADVAAELTTRIEQIAIGGDFQTNIGARVFRGRKNIDESLVPCTSIVEGNDSNEGTPGRSSQVKVAQSYAFVSYLACDPDNPNDAAHAALRDLKRAIFRTDNKPDATLGRKVQVVNYRGRNIGTRADGVPIVQAILEIEVVFVEDLASP